jgi:hypothetical protein
MRVPGSHRRTSVSVTHKFISLAAVGIPIALAAWACSPRGDTKAAMATDTTLSRDLAAANASPAAVQPQLKDVALPAKPAKHHVSRVAPPPPPPAMAHEPGGMPSVSSPEPAIAAPAAPAPLPALVAPSGASLDIALADTVTTATAHVGDAVHGKVASDVRDASGAVVIPAGSAATGTVSTSTGPAHTPHLGVSFSAVSVRGKSYPVQGTISSLPIVQSRRTARVAQVGEVAGGAAVGGLIGNLIGHGRAGGTVVGAVAGGAAGAVVADKTESHDAVLPRGAHVTVQLTAPISVPQ